MTAGTHTDGNSAPQAESKQSRPGATSKGQMATPSAIASSHHSTVPAWNGPQQASGVTAANGDPFINGSSNDGAKLNGKAVSFSPSVSSGQTAPISYLTKSSEADEGPVIVSSTGESFSAKRPDGQSKPGQLPIGTPGKKTSPVRAKPVFTTDVGPNITVPGGHYLKLENLAVADLDATLKTLCETMGWKTKVRGFVVPVPVNGRATVWVSFDDIREADRAIEDVEVGNPGCTLNYITQTEYAFGTKTGDERGIQDGTSFYDGQVTLTALYTNLKGFDADGLYEYVKGTMESFGDIIGVIETVLDAHVRQYRVEFMKISDAKFVAESVTEDEPAVFKGWKITARELPDINSQAVSKHGKLLNGTPQKIAKANGGILQYASPTGRTAWTIDDNGQAVAMPGRKKVPKVASIKAGVTLTPNSRQQRGSDPSPRTPATFVPAITYARSGSWPESNLPTSTGPHTRRRLPDNGPTRIDRERILNGIDVRTTVMVRNVPNEMDAEQLKACVEKVCPGRFDFMYLRFDFQKNQNVGYAFVNFLTPEDVLKFVDAYDGQEYVEGLGHHPVYGPRRGEMAYATVQGQDCAIEKFRNSSIMCEYPGYRPRLFWTVEDAPTQALVGKEREFPGINNMSKHNRSKDNAAQIGLYAPKNRQGAIMVRNSQYDRGTPAQMQEDATFQEQQMMAQSYGYGYNDPNYVLTNPHMSMPMGMPAGPFGVMYGPPNPYYQGHTVMNGSPYGYAPTVPAFRGTPGPVVPPRFNPPAWNGSPRAVPPSRLRTITQGRLGNGRGRRQQEVHPGRDMETALRQIEENKREQAAYDAAFAEIDAQEAAAAEAMQAGSSADVPRFMNGDDSASFYYADHNADTDGYSHGTYGDNDGAYANNAYTSDSGEYVNGAYGYQKYQ